MGAKPRGVPPHELAIGAGMDFAATDGELYVPHVGVHLPEDEAAGLGGPRNAAVLSDLVRRFELRRHHSDLSHGVGVADRALELQPS